MLIACGLAEQTGKHIRLSTKTIVGTTLKDVGGQIDVMLITRLPPDAAVMLVCARVSWA